MTRDQIAALEEYDIAHHAPESKRRALRVLVAAGDDQARQCIGRLLEHETGWIVDECSDLGHLLIQVHAAPPNLVLLDQTYFVPAEPKAGACRTMPPMRTDRPLVWIAPFADRC